jgi:IclR family KDG regulon transcriptional repressor
MKIQSLQRAMDILSLFSLSHPSYSLAEIAVASGLNKGTAWGLVSTLEQGGILEQEPDTRRYRLGPAIYSLGMIYAGSLQINNAASAAAHRLSSRCKATTRIGIWDRDAVLITMLVIPDEQQGLAPQIGPRIPGYCTALGKAILAFLEASKLEAYLSQVDLIAYTPSTITSQDRLMLELEEIRSHGYSVSRDEMIPGVTGIAAPIFGRNGDLVAAISLGDNRMGQQLNKNMDRFSSELKSVAHEISQQMGFGPEAMRERALELRKNASVTLGKKRTTKRRSLKS